MNRSTLLRLSVGLVLACGAVVSAQRIPLPDEPALRFGVSVTPSFEGWFDNPDGTHNFLVGYLNRNRGEAVDVPIGPNNHMDPGGPDLGQPTHFLAGRNVGLFVVSVPKDVPATTRYTWTLIVNGENNTIPFTLKPEYNVNPFKQDANNNTPPVLHLFQEQAAGVQGPVAMLSKAVTRTATMAAGVELPLWAEDDAKYTSGTNAPLGRARPPVNIVWNKYRGPGNITFDKQRPTMEALMGGAVDQPYKGKTTATAKFSAPGEYVLHVTANDYSGTGELCCWTTAMVKVNVTP
jgi:hypothetical protein